MNQPFTLFDRFRQVLVPTYSPTSVAPVRGQGCRVWDSEGKEYLDAVAGIAVASLGHAHPDLTASLAQQAERIMAISNLFLIEEEIRAAEKLIRSAFPGKVFFANSGAEANEAAIKFARRYFFKKGDQARYHIVSFEGSFHGRTLATLAATGQSRFQEGFGPLPGGFRCLPYDHPETISGALDETVAAVMVEVIQGESGVRVASQPFLEALQREVSRVGCLLIVDEVQTGTGRCGSWFAYQAAGLAPDIITSAKGLGGGVPVGACLTTDAVAAAMNSGCHGSTFGGNPLAMAAVRCVLEVIERDGLVNHAATMGKRLLEGLQDQVGSHPVVKEIRGRGLMVGIELGRPAQPVADKAREKGLLVNVTAERVIRLLPPLVISPSEVDEIVSLLTESVKESS